MATVNRGLCQVYQTKDKGKNWDLLDQFNVTTRFSSKDPFYLSNDSQFILFNIDKQGYVVYEKIDGFYQLVLVKDDSDSWPSILSKSDIISVQYDINHYTTNRNTTIWQMRK